MLEFLRGNLANILIVAGLAAVVALIVAGMVKKKKSGRKDDWFDSWIDQHGIKDEFRYETGKSPGRKNSGQGKSNKTSVDRYGNKKTSKKRK